jgi:hypothetical protein
MWRNRPKVKGTQRGGTRVGYRASGGRAVAVPSGQHVAGCVLTAELQRRLADHEAHPEACIPWETAREQARRRQ